MAKSMKTKMQLAKLVRKRAEKYADTLIPYTDPTRLDCLCAISSFALTKIFNNHKHKARMVVGHYDDEVWGLSPHCWTESDDGIWDVTATQFDGSSNPRILRTKINDERFHKAKEIRLDLANHILYKWPSEQKPLLRNVKLLLND